MRHKICAHCFHFRPNEAGPPKGGDSGLCLRYPPVPMLMQHRPNIVGDLVGGVGMAGINPPVNDHHTCGEFKDSKPLALAG